MMQCIGVPKRHFLHFFHYPGCGEKWERDTLDGKCPICRGFLIPESMVTEEHKRNMLTTSQKTAMRTQK
jgi:DNA polymerase II large subunit